MEEKVIGHGFDRGIDYQNIKKKLVKRAKYILACLQHKKKNIQIKRLIYLIVACIQLRNGSRISEAVKSFFLFMKNGIDKRVIVKISKTGAIKTNKKGEKIRTKERFREMTWPNWISNEIYEILANCKLVNIFLSTGTLKKRVLDYLRINFNCNTHSLRYAFINYALYILKRPMNDVAKFVGHANTAQMVTYTQKKNSDQLFDIDM